MCISEIGRTIAFKSRFQSKVQVLLFVSAAVWDPAVAIVTTIEPGRR